MFLLSVSYSARNDPREWAYTYKNSFVSMNRAASSKHQTRIRKWKLYNFWIFIFYLNEKRNRAIRTRTVDFLGKTDQTDYYQNDPNCFKDPTCIFFALGSFINWYKYQPVRHIFSWQKKKEMAPCALIHYFYFDPGALPKCFRKGLSWRRSASGLEQPKLNKVSIARPKNQIWNFIHLKVHRTKRYFIEVLILIMPSIEYTGYLPYQYLKSMMGSVWHLHLNGMGTWIRADHSFVRLLFSCSLKVME